MDHLTVILICIVIFCLCMALLKATVWSQKKLQQKQAEQAQAKAEAQFTPEQLRFLKTVGSLYNENAVKTMSEIYEACGMPHDIAFSRNPALIEEHIPFVKGTDPYNVFMTYVRAVSNRHALAFSEIFEHPNDVLNINLHKNEKIYHVIYNVVLHQEKTTVTNIAYSGVVWRSGLLRAGNLSVMHNEITRFAPVDAGNLIFTNERLIFIGKQKNVTKQIKLNDILFNNLYKDGVLVNIPNRRPLLFKFPDYKDWELFEISDGINEYVLVYNRMIDGNYNQNLLASPKVEAPMQLVDKTKSLVGEVLASKNFDELTKEVIFTAKKGETASTSRIQRDFSIGYSRAGKIMDELEQLNFVTPASAEGRKWLIDGNDVTAILTEMDKLVPEE